MQKTAVVSFSGGRTSAYMVYLIEEMRKSGEWTAPVEYVFMDTGAEHPKTYEFIRKCVAHFGIDLTCLQADFEQPIGKGHSYNRVSVSDLKHDMISGPFGRMMAKYGVPTVASAWCTSRMKEETNDKYCEDKYGKGNYSTWLGIRFDEPARLVGLVAYRKLKSAGLSDLFISRCFADAVQSDGLLCESELIKEIALRKKSEGLNYLASIIDDEKSDVIDFWSRMPFDLEIDEHLGNCVFCFKKSINKVALAARDEPELASHFIDAISKANNRLNEGSAIPKGVMFRSNNSLQSIIAKFELHSRDDIADTIRSMKRKDSGGCTESCEAFSCQLDMFEG